MTNRLGIEMLTLLGMPPVEHVTLAAELGCVTISTGLMKLPLSPFGYPQLETLYEPWSLLDDAALRRARQELGAGREWQEGRYNQDRNKKYTHGRFLSDC